MTTKQKPQREPKTKAEIKAAKLEMLLQLLYMETNVRRNKESISEINMLLMKLSPPFEKGVKIRNSINSFIRSNDNMQKHTDKLFQLIDPKRRKK